ncbi:MAG TPA: YncE family protein [Dinghuibacter sp.]|uniref:YncE family protein n=1 Tax=Dinghuibacter sp. TaxID=2024697 RepID=UPI002B91F5C9|nr:YncE family protein [Dinghuibacter sp.]HTJ10813.1 YncE family protein [Dinghuibacter sp.]
MLNKLIATALLLVSTRAFSQQYVFDKKISLPGDAGWDYVAIDDVNHHLFVSHGTAFNVVDLTTEQPIGLIDGLQGVHGIAIVNSVNKGFISDGKAQAVVVIDLSTFKVLKTIRLKETDEDGIIYDPFSDKVFVFNGDSKSTCVIDVHSLEPVKTIDLGGGPEFAVSDGHGLVYNNIEDLSSLKVIDTKTMEVKATYPLSPCGGPTGIAYDAANKRLFTGCRANKGLSVVDATTGKVIQTLPIGAGVDAVVYDATRALIFVSCGDATTTIIHQDTPDKYSVVQTLATKTRAKTMALDKTTGKIYLSTADMEPGTRKVVPGTFGVYVYKPS